eukprot:RCo004589
MTKWGSILKGQRVVVPPSSVFRLLGRRLCIARYDWPVLCVWRSIEVCYGLGRYVEMERKAKIMSTSFYGCGVVRGRTFLTWTAASVMSDGVDFSCGEQRSGFI